MTIDPSDSNYFDWNNSFNVIKKAYDTSLFVLIIGPKGTGKTSLVRKFASEIGKALYSINFSLRTRESHLVGTKTMNQGEITFVEGILIKSMRDGGILYLDELNAAEADVFWRLDEALDEKKNHKAPKLANTLREAASLEELYYSPSIRESIAFAKLITNKVSPKNAAEVVYANVYDQWGEVEYRKVMDMITSIFA